jgi:tetratricopeptide (TPR) repeat protein
VYRSISVTLVLTAGFWLALRNFIPILSIDLDRHDAADLGNSGAADPIDALSRIIDRQSTESLPAEYLAETYMQRGSFWLQKREPQKALADFDAALKLNAEERAALFGRAECYRQLASPTGPRP